MKKLIFSILVIIPSLSIAQKSKYGLPDFNMAEIKNLKDSGSFDALGLRTGTWVEYSFDSTGIKDYIQGMDQGYNSYPLFDKVLIKMTGKYITGHRQGNWKIYKSYSTSKPFHWDLEEEIVYKNGSPSGQWKYYTTTGKVIAEQTYKDGYPDGVYKKYYPNGKPEYETPLKNGLTDGVQKMYNDRGVLIFTAKFTKGYYDGAVRYYYSNGKLKLERIYKSGMLLKETKLMDRNEKPLEKGTLDNGDGTIIFYNDMCAKTLVSMYKNGLQNGKGTEYYATGIVKREFNCVNDTVEGIEKSYDEKGNIQIESTVKKGIYDGKRTVYYPSGKICEVLTMKDGFIWNELSSLDTNGKALDFGTFKDGSGILKFYDDSSRLAEIDEYKDGRQNGYAKIYYPNGKIQFELAYKNDTITGIAKSYYKTGVLEDEGEVVNGKYYGIKKYYYPNGKLSEEEYMIKNNSWNIIQKYDTNGVALDRNNFKDGTGIMKCYNDSGMFYLTLPFLNGLYNGPSTRYYPSGKIMVQSSYVNDTLEGTYTTYYENGNVKEVSSRHKGAMDGICTIYHDNGQIWTQVEYIDGYYWNIKMNNDRNGKAQDKGTLVDGTGTIINYDESGKIIKTFYFVHGEIDPNK